MGGNRPKTIKIKPIIQFSSNPPFLAAVEARDKQGHRFIRRPDLQLLIDAVAALALAAFELVGHCFWFFLKNVHVALHLGVQDDRPALRVHVLRLHKRNVVRCKLFFGEADRKARVAYVRFGHQIHQDGPCLVLVQGDKAGVFPVFWRLDHVALVDAPIENAHFEVFDMGDRQSGQRGHLIHKLDSYFRHVAVDFELNNRFKFLYSFVLIVCVYNCYNCLLLQFVKPFKIKK